MLSRVFVQYHSIKRIQLYLSTGTVRKTNANLVAIIQIIHDKRILPKFKQNIVP